jgi:sarcosine oxidase subunit gamma
MVDLRIHAPEPHGRALVRLRVPLALASDAAALARLPLEPLTVGEGDPAALWLGPEHWLLVSTSRSADAIVAELAARLQGVLHHATDTSDGLALITVEGRAALGLLAMHSGLDLSQSPIGVGRCARTRMEKVAVFVHAIDAQRFDLYVDRSAGHYLLQWLRRSARDPILASAGTASDAIGTPGPSRIPDA